MSTTYRCGFYKEGTNSEPQFYTTDEKPVAHRGFLIYLRIKPSRRGDYGCADTVIDGLCIMQTITVQGAMERIDDMLDNPGTVETRALDKMRAHGIRVSDVKGAEGGSCEAEPSVASPERSAAAGGTPPSLTLFDHIETEQRA